MKLLWSLFYLLAFAIFVQADGVEFHVVDLSSVPIEDATVSISVSGGAARINDTDANGNAIFNNICLGEEIAFSVSKAGYLTQVGKFKLTTCTEYQTIFLPPGLGLFQQTGFGRFRETAAYEHPALSF